MEKCVKCGADTILRVNGVPVCVDCDQKRSSGELPARPVQRDSGKPPSQDNKLSRSAAG